MSESRRNRRLIAAGRENNFNIIRMIATIFVVVGHMSMILGLDAPMFGGVTLHSLAVEILFIISGYLISLSWLSDPHPVRYAVKRFFRLWPPFAVMVLLLTFVGGPLLSELGWRGYFSSWFYLFLKNLRFYIVFAQPGVFAEQPIAYSSNGSMWTMPIEAAFYVILPILLTLLRVRGRSKRSFYAMATLVAAMCAFDMYLRIFWKDQVYVFYGTDLISAYHLSVFYMIGVLFTYDEMKRLLNMQVAFAGICLIMATQSLPVPVKYLVLHLTLPYAILSFALAAPPVFSKWGSKIELSYSIYLYAFFFQQAVAYISTKNGLGWGYELCLLISSAVTVAVAFASFYLVEQPSLRLSRKLVARIGKKRAA
ncbi:MAG: acyltransferase [Clostridia bacterium]|nr:acyltransferase [Clostridia bacterium]